MVVEIIVQQNNCSGCRICQFFCSNLHHGEYNPSKAYIQIVSAYSLQPKISFLEGCTKCGQCVNHCLYDALIVKEEIG